MKRFIIGLGEVLWDILPQGKQLGGAPTNFAYHVGQFGFNSKVVSAIGNDLLGAEIKDFMSLRDIDNYLAISNYPTGTVEVELDSLGIPSYQIKEEVAWDYIPFDAQIKAIAQNTQAVCFGTLAQRASTSHKTIHEFLKAMPKDQNTLKIFDINLRQSFYTKEVIEASLKVCNTLKINDEELIVVDRLFELKGKNAEHICRSLMDKFEISTLILTCGAHGSHVFIEQKHSFKETPKVNVIDTVGAGDSFTASFCASILRGMSMREAHQRAVDVSAFVCSNAGAMPKLLPEHLI